MLIFGTPYSTERDIGKSYNRFMARFSDEDWVCFTDGDSMFTTHYFGHQIQEVIDANPEYSTFTCMTNRVMTPYQRDMKYWAVNDMSSHWDIGANYWDTWHTEVQDITDEQPFSGVMILTQVKTWRDLGGFPEGAMLGIDNAYHLANQKAGLKVGLMKGIYLMHYYRNGNPNDKQHLL